MSTFVQRLALLEQPYVRQVDISEFTLLAPQPELVQAAEQPVDFKPHGVRTPARHGEQIREHGALATHTQEPEESGFEEMALLELGQQTRLLMWLLKYMGIA